MLNYGISLTLVASALDEVHQNRDLIKLSEASEDERELLSYLHENLDACHKEAMSLFNSWRDGFLKEAEAQGLTEGMVKQALLGIDMPAYIDMPLTLAAYMTPVLGTALTGADAIRNFGNMFGKNLTWKQRLGYGGMGLLDTGLTALSLVPGLGALGGAAKAGQLGGKAAKVGGLGGKLAGLFGKLNRMGSVGEGAVKHVAGLADRSAALTGKMLGAAESGKGLTGSAMRLAGFSPGYQAGKIRNVLRAGAQKVPGLNRIVDAPMQYLNPYERLLQFNQLARTGQGAVTATRGAAQAGKEGLSQFGNLWEGSKLIDNPGWRRMMTAYMPASMGLAAMSGDGRTYETGSSAEEMMQRFPADVGRSRTFNRMTPLIRNRAGGYRPI